MWEVFNNWMGEARSRWRWMMWIGSSIVKSVWKGNSIGWISSFGRGTRWIVCWEEFTLIFVSFRLSLARVINMWYHSLMNTCIMQQSISDIQIICVQYIQTLCHYCRKGDRLQVEMLTIRQQWWLHQPRVEHLLWGEWHQPFNGSSPFPTVEWRGGSM